VIFVFRELFEKFLWLVTIRKERPHLWATLGDEDALDAYFSKADESLIARLKIELNGLIEINTYLSENMSFPIAKRPVWLNRGVAYTPRTLVFTTSLGFKYYNVNYKDFYVPYPSLLKVAKSFKGLDHDIKLYKIWEYTVNLLRYVNDKKEDWRAPNLTNIIKYGDCEDGTILFITLAGMCGIPSDSVFNACGYFYKSNGEKFGHSYPIVKRADGLWYIFETTLSSISGKRPKLFKGSNYDASWGVHNWAYEGHIKGELNDGKRQI